MALRRLALLVLVPGLALLEQSCGGSEPAVGGPNVVLITVESLRTDHVGVYGGRSRSRPEIPVTPELDAFAGGATVYEDAHSVTSWTLASHASLFTGLYPSGHQTDAPRDRLDDSYRTLAEILAEAGYQTAGVVSGPYLRRTHNLDQGFEYWDDSAASLTNALGHDDVTNPKLETGLRRFFESERDPERPFLLFAYFWDPHFDFLPPPPYDEMFVGPDCERVDVRGFDTGAAVHAGMPAGQLAYVFSQYAGEVRATDVYLGRLFQLLKELGLWDDTIVIVTADHGEEFFDHGEKGHKNNLYAETTRVPLIVKYPGQHEGRRDDRLVSLVDLLPTLVELTSGPDGGADGPPVHGRSLLVPEPDAGRVLLYELRALRYYRSRDGEISSRGKRWYGVRQGDWKLVWSQPDTALPASPPDAELYQVSADPGETTNLAQQEPERRERLRERLEAELERARGDASHYHRGGPAQLSADEIEQLRELGYLGS